MEPRRINGPMLAAMAVYIGKTRLIDNLIIEEKIIMYDRHILFFYILCEVVSCVCLEMEKNMTVTMLKAKIHRATVVQSELDYVGSITIDEELMEAAGIYEYEKVQIADVNNGNRFETYVISGEKGSGMICLNGAAAHR